MWLLKTREVGAEDPFRGYAPQPVSCRWLSPRDGHLGASAEMIRLVVDEARGHCGPWANATYQQNFLRDVQRFIGPTRAVLVTPAGTITSYIGALDPTLSSLDAGVNTVRTALRHVQLGNGEMLVGVDGAVRGDTTPLQTVMHLKPGGAICWENTTVKLHPAEGESGSLIGWRLCSELGKIPAELATARRVTTAFGDVLVLVCHDGVIFSGRSRSNLSSELGMMVRKHFAERALAAPLPNYILMATHWQGVNPDSGRWSGEAFRQAAMYLAQHTRATVIMTMRAPLEELESAARRFSVIGPRASRVATLIVEDTEIQNESIPAG